MCSTNERPKGSTMPSRPSWSGLYARAGLMLAALCLMQAVITPGAELVAIECSLVLVGFVSMAQWTRRNHVAFDYTDWCDCASSRVTVRVISSHHGRPAPLEDATAWAQIDAEAAQPPLEEVVR
jgi:hypothetical protein